MKTNLIKLVALTMAIVISVFIYFYYSSLHNKYSVDSEVIQIVVLSILILINAMYFSANVRKSIYRFIAVMFIMTMSLYIGFNHQGRVRSVQVLILAVLLIANVMVLIINKRHHQNGQHRAE
jgi:O-antigen ligase